MIAAAIVSVVLAVALPKTIMVSVSDFLCDIPRFNNAPDFNLMAGLSGGMPVGMAGESTRKSKRQIEKEIIDLAWSVYPDALSIKIFRGTLIIKLPEGA